MLRRGIKHHTTAGAGTIHPHIWAQRLDEIGRFAKRQLFFVGGAPRSGTTWLQHLLDSHPDVSCSGEALFQHGLVDPLGTVLTQWRDRLEAKNTTTLRHFGGYPLPSDTDGDTLAATAILLALQRQCAGRTCRVVGEKTPENVFFFPHLKRLFAGAKFIGIARDPRDVLASAWHFFGQPAAGVDHDAAKTEFVRRALPALNDGAQAMIDLAERHPQDCLVVTYEALHHDAHAVTTQLFGFLGVPAHEAIVQTCLARTSFNAMTQGRAPGRAPGIEQRGSFFRQGAVGTWPATLTPPMNAMVLQTLGWTFPHFGWQP